MGGIVVFFILLWAGLLAFWIWALVDAIQVPDDRFYRSGTKLVWVLVIVLTGAIGSIIYLAAGRPDAATRATMKQPAPSGSMSPHVPPRPPGSL